MAYIDSAAKSYNYTLSQEGILNQCMEHPSDRLFHTQLIINIEGVVDTNILKQSWTIISQKHVAPRTTIDSEAGNTMNFDKINLDFQVDHVKYENENELDEKSEEWKTDDLTKEFDLTDQPLWRVRIMQSTRSTRVLWSFHYLIMDDVSADIVLKEVKNCYTALSNGYEYSDKVPPQMPDYLEWLGKCPETNTLNFWEREIANLSSSSQLPFETSALSKFRAENEEPMQIKQTTVPLTETDIKHMKMTAALYGITLEELVQGAWALLLGVYLGTEEVVLGITSSGRSGSSKFDKIVGCLIRTLPLKLDLSPHQTVSNWLNIIKEKNEAIYQHEHCSLTEILAMTDVAPGENIFDSVVTSSKAITDVKVSDSEMQWSMIFKDTRASYSLMIDVSAQVSPIITLRFDTRSYEQSVIERVAQHFAQTLSQLSIHHETTLGELTLIPIEESKKLVVEWNDTEREYSSQHMHTMFEKQAEKNPEALALLFDDKTSTYGEVEDYANKIANYLIKFGVRRNDNIAILTERSIKMIPTLLGILKASACYIPLDPGAPSKRWHLLLKSMEVKYLITQTHLLEQLELEGALIDMEHVILLDDIPYNYSQSNFRVHTETDVLQASARRPLLLGIPEDPAYIIFTSGTTGTPKGVVVTHDPVVNLIEWVNSTFNVNENDRILFITSLTFDLSIYDIFGMLAAGGTIRIATSSDIREPSELVRYIREEPITFWDSAPAALMQILPFLDSKENLAVSTDLRLVFMSGDWIPLRSPAALKASFPNVTVVSLGGATEATVWSNYHIVDYVDPSWASIPYGRPI